MDPNVKLYMDQGELLSNPEGYRRLVGKLNYLTITHSNISFAFNIVSQYMATPHFPHWEAILRIVRCLKAYPNHGFLYKVNGHLQVEALQIQIRQKCPQTKDLLLDITLSRR